MTRDELDLWLRKVRRYRVLLLAQAALAVVSLLGSFVLPSAVSRDKLFGKWADSLVVELLWPLGLIAALLGYFAWVVKVTIQVSDRIKLMAERVEQVRDPACLPLLDGAAGLDTYTAAAAARAARAIRTGSPR